MAIIGYIRCSTETQADSALGMEAQRAAIIAYATKAGLTIDSIQTDAGLSGALGIEDRPGLLAALGLMRKGGTLICAKRDRLARDLMLSLWLAKEAERVGFKIVSAAGEGTEDDSPAGILMGQIIAAFGEYERKIIRARIKAAAAAKRSRGELWGNLRYGDMLDGKRVVPNPEEQAVIAYMKTLHASGLGSRAIAARLNDEGVATRPVTRKGTTWAAKWHATSVLRALQRT